jgi:hypothetical protein
MPSALSVDEFVFVRPASTAFVLLASCGTLLRSVELQLFDVLKASGFDHRTVMNGLAVHDLSTILGGLAI